ncbi:general secretion pathway protein GspJ [Isoalcanivorax pacificus W11-5]|uniref:Type II secretion system protein J n=1 Tax=Isoalcanivorax pacificus W11-5 TaxID=391936 RepID=A0A0B4XP22_9GAMM|nr:type II secretion system minor pseudopilin GspJ [Isoalcanivorax pacificus]AJD48233.1 general secretion pathway protein GspJ [Isoalcanivorax pacificus W11-5]
MRRQAGFTLLEVIIAIAIFALMYVIAQASFSESLNSRAMLAEHATRQETKQRALIFLAQDIEQLIARPVRDPFGDPQPAVRGTLEYFEFTRLGWANPFDLRDRSQMQRVAYLLDEEQRLVRRHWPALDVNVGTEPTDTVMLEEVETLQFRYLGQGPEGDWQWRELWPDVDLEQTPPLFQALPKSIEMEIRMEDGSRLHRYFRTVLNPWSQT